MHSRHAFHPDLVENALEDRTLLAAFLDSTYFQYNFGSGMSLFQFNNTSASALSLTDAGGPLGNNGSFASNYAAGSSYIGFGSNSFGSGLSPLDGVVSGYSMNTALSNELGDGSSLPGAGSFSDGFNEFIPGADASLRAGAIGGPVNVTTSPGDLVGPVGYGSSFSSGGNFSLNLLGGKIYGTGQSLIGTLSASATAIGHGSFEEPSAESGTGQDQGQNPNGPKRGRPGEKLLTNPATRVPSRRDQAPPPNKETAPRPATPPQPESASPRRLPPLPASEGRETVPTGPVRQAPEQKPAAPPAESAPAPPAENPGGLTLLLDTILRVPFFGKP